MRQSHLRQPTAASIPSRLALQHKDSSSNYAYAIQQSMNVSVIL